MSDFKAIGFRVVIKRDPVDVKSKGGILLADSTVQKNQGAQIMGTLVAVGPVAFTGPDWGASDRDTLKVGTRVIYRRYSGQPFTLDQNNPDADRYEICADSDVYMPIPDGANLTFMKRD